MIATALHRYVRYYFDYLTEKIRAFKCFGKSSERLEESEAMAWAMSLTIDGFCRYAPLVATQFELLVAVRIASTHVTRRMFSHFCYRNRTFRCRTHRERSHHVALRALIIM
jgi:hypothetical protein